MLQLTCQTSQFFYSKHGFLSISVKAQALFHMLGIRTCDLFGDRELAFFGVQPSLCAFFIFPKRRTVRKQHRKGVLGNEKKDK